MKLYNTLSRKVDDFKPIDVGKVRIYSCGPTVYDHIHIGNLSAFIYADTLRRVIAAQGLKVRHVMNFTDVDDKTIRRSHEKYPDIPPLDALRKLTTEYGELFLQDMRAIGNDTDAMEFIKATDSIEAIRQLIKELHDSGFAYITDDGVYFSIEKYRASGKTYGQLLKLSVESTSNARIDNDEYDKESVHDFALWKSKKPAEPVWEFELDGKDVSGRPGWHIECSAMSLAKLGQPFDIHTGGVDLIFPHHENEIAQSTAGNGAVLANNFFHNEHLLVDGKKMSKSLGNFFTLRDIQKKGYDPMAFRLMVLQSHYRSQSNFTWETLAAAGSSLKNIRNSFNLVYQGGLINADASDQLHASFAKFKDELLGALTDDLNTAKALTVLHEYANGFEHINTSEADIPIVENFSLFVEMLLGFSLVDRQISDKEKSILAAREKARNDQNFERSDELRDELRGHGIGVRDTDQGQIWYRL